MSIPVQKAPQMYQRRKMIEGDMFVCPHPRLSHVGVVLRHQEFQMFWSIMVNHIPHTVIEYGIVLPNDNVRYFLKFRIIS
jgi:hypothetical protein